MQLRQVKKAASPHPERCRQRPTLTRSNGGSRRAPKSPAVSALAPGVRRDTLWLRQQVLSESINMPPFVGCNTAEQSIGTRLLDTPAFLLTARQPCSRIFCHYVST